MAFIAVVFERVDDEHEDGGGEELVGELRRRGVEGLGVGAEDACGGCGAGRDGADAGAFDLWGC